MFAASMFYAVVGIICFAVLVVVDFRLVHIGIIGILSLMTAYGVLNSRVWTMWGVVALFFIGTTFSAYMVYRTAQKNILYDVILIAYLLLTWIFTAYTTSKRKVLKS